MKTYKILLGMVLISALLISCSKTTVDENQTVKQENISKDEIHSNSLPTTLPNIEDEKSEMFGKDFSQSVDTTDVSVGNLKGYFTQPKAPGEYPGVVMIHEWWGLNDQVKYMAELLANEGYKVFAVDLYDEVATTQEKAKEYSTKVRENPDVALAKMKLAYDYLKANNTTKMASLGWCFGGQQSLNLSLGEDLDATVIYYGNLTNDKEKLINISAPVLGIFGETDTSVTVESVKSFQQALSELNINNQIVIYPGVGHAFANPTGNNFSKPETLDAWDKTLTFLKTNLK